MHRLTLPPVLALAGLGCGRLRFDVGATDAVIEDSALASCTNLSGAIARYPLDGDATDAVAAADGTEDGVPAYAAGRFAEAVALDGIDDMIRLPYLIPASYTVVFWVRTVAIAPGTSADLWFTGLSLLDGEVCGTPVGGDWGTALIDGGHLAVDGVATHSPGTINDDAWHQIGYSREFASDGNAFYIDGVAIASDTSGPSAGQMQVNIPFIGVGNSPCRAPTGVQFFPGSIDEIAIFDRVLAPTEIVQIHSCQVAL